MFNYDEANLRLWCEMGKRGKDGLDFLKAHENAVRCMDVNIPFADRAEYAKELFFLLQAKTWCGRTKVAKPSAFHSSAISSKNIERRIRRSFSLLLLR